MSEKLQQLFNDFVDELGRVVKEGRKVSTKDGDIVNVTADATYFDVARKLLEQHGIGEKTGGGKKIAGLLDDIETPFRGDEDYSDDPDLRSTH